MKALFLALLLANVFYAGWRLWIVPSTAPPAFVEAEGVPQLELIEARHLAASDNEEEVAGDGGARSRGVEARLADGGRDAELEHEPEPEAAQDDRTGPETTAAVADSGAESGSADPVDGASGVGETDGSARDDDEIAAPAVAVAAITPAPGRCVSLGPFVNLREANEATTMLSEAGLQPSQRLAESQVWFGHWVHLPEQATRAAAIEIVENLREQGVSDIYIEPSGPFRNYISLGVFTDAAHAETRAGHIRRLGISPQIRDRYRDSSEYWVDFTLPAERDIDPALYQASPARVLRLEDRDCPGAPG